MDIRLATTWILFLALFPMAFLWLRRAWRIIFLHDYTEVALKRGEASPRPKRFAPACAAIHLTAGGVCSGLIVAILFFGTPYETWTAIAGSTLWLKLTADFILGRHAHAPQKTAKR